MDRIKIIGGQRLNGTIPISGAKNAALPLMIASLLTADRLTLKNVPNLADVNLLARILRNHGVDLAVDGKRPGPARTSGRDLPPHRARHRRHHRALRDGQPHARQLLGARAAARALRPGQGVAARRLRHRHASGRPAPDGPQGARRRDRHRRRLRASPRRRRRPARRAHRLSRRSRSAPRTTCCWPPRWPRARP